MKVHFEINKNLTCIFALLNRFDPAFGEAGHPLRKHVISHFDSYKGTAPDIKKYGHEYQLVVYALSVTDVPELETISQPTGEHLWHFEKGQTIKPYILDFYKNTDFENYYEEYLKPQLTRIAESYEIMTKNLNLSSLLVQTWKNSTKYMLNIIPNPFSGGSFGPKIGDKPYQIIGEVSDSYLPKLILHEGSHPLAKKYLEPYSPEIEKYTGLLEIAQRQPNYSKAYNSWKTCFEEHFIRAVQIGLMNKQIDPEYDIEKWIRLEKKNKGMVFIDVFYSQIRNGVEESSVPKILELLSKETYKS